MFRSLTLTLTLTVAVCSLTAGLAQAQTTPTLQGAIEGLGQRPCSELVAARQDSPEQYRSFAIWMSGFISAANGYQADTYDLTPWQPLEMSIAQVHNFCQANPERALAQAIVTYLNFLRDERIKEPSQPISARNGANAVFIYPEILAQVHTKLQVAKLLPAEHGGDFDAAFGEAIMTYQRVNGLKQNGLPDTATLIHLFR